VSGETDGRHWHREPAQATKEFADAAPFARTGKGLQAAIEVIAYPAGHVQVVASRISGAPGKRSIVQAGGPLMFNDIDEAKDAVVLILDRLNTEAERETSGE
jgi:hypothetical protein